MIQKNIPARGLFDVILSAAYGFRHPSFGDRSRETFCPTSTVLSFSFLDQEKKKSNVSSHMGLGLVSRETKEGGRIIVEVDGKLAKIRNLKVSLKLFSFCFPLRGWLLQGLLG